MTDEETKQDELVAVAIDPDQPAGRSFAGRAAADWMEWLVEGMGMTTPEEEGAYVSGIELGILMTVHNKRDAERILAGMREVVPSPPTGPDEITSAEAAEGTIMKYMMFAAAHQIHMAMNTTSEAIVEKVAKGEGNGRLN